MLYAFTTFRTFGSALQVYYWASWQSLGERMAGDDLPYAVEATVALSDYEISVMNQSFYFTVTERRV